MRRIAVVDGHPDPSDERLTHALADHYAQTARGSGNEVRRINVARMHFPLLRTAEDFQNGTPPEDIQHAQRDLKWADHIVFFYPMWDGDMPALLKAFIEQAFRPGFALEYTGKNRFPKRLMTGKTGRIVMTMGMPPFIYRSLFGAYSLKSFKRSILNLCGIKPVESTLIGVVDDAPECRSRKWFDRVAAAAEEDVAEPEPRNRGARIIAIAGALAAAGYAAYAVTAWARYGRRTFVVGEEGLLDRIMPDYEVSVRHRITVHAPAQQTFDTIRDQDFRRFSPAVRGLFRAREVLLGAKHVKQVLPQGLLKQLLALGWKLVAENPGREIVLATVTQPWQPNPVFKAQDPDEFLRFSEPGFAKIALTLRVDPIAPEICEVRTETRVRTTDPMSRARFRRYWALLSPGIEIIRVFLLRQIKAEAEARWSLNRDVEGLRAEEFAPTHTSS